MARSCDPWNNRRRGALLISLDIRHPDALRFIWSKSKPEEVFGRDALTGKVQDVFGANISLKIPRSFMDAVRNDKTWDFIFPDRDADPHMYDTMWDGSYEKWARLGGAIKVHTSMPAKQVYKELCASAYESGDPGVLFIDRVQEWTLGSYIDDSLVPTSTNPCGVQ